MNALFCIHTEVQRIKKSVQYKVQETKRMCANGDSNAGRLLELMEGSHPNH